MEASNCLHILLEGSLLGLHGLDSLVSHCLPADSCLHQLEGPLSLRSCWSYLFKDVQVLLDGSDSLELVLLSFLALSLFDVSDTDAICGL